MEINLESFDILAFFGFARGLSKKIVINEINNF